MPRDLYVIGRGIGLGIAQEAALKFKETCGLHAEAFSSAEVRHGPMAIVRAGFPVLTFAQNDETPDGVKSLATELRRTPRGCDDRRGESTASGSSAEPQRGSYSRTHAVLCKASIVW